jgi:galactose mutarotase-like enzyme
MIDRRSVFVGAAILAGAAQDGANAQKSGVAAPAPGSTGVTPALVSLAPANGILRAQVAPDVGGELAGLQCKLGGEFRELLYHGRDYRPVKGWTGRAPTLWPGVGRNAVALSGAKPGDAEAGGWIWKGQRYPMLAHGFVRGQKWRLEKSFSGDATAYSVVSTADSAATRVLYPFGFRMAIEHRVAGSSVILSYRISAAKANSDPMPFSIGNHITFNVPFAPAGRGDQVMITSSATRHVLLGPPGNTPTGQVTDTDFSKPRTLASLGVQTPYSLAGCPPGDVWTRLEDPAGMAITISHQSDWRPQGEPVLFNLWGDVPQGFFAPEPWMGKQGSLVTGDGLIHLPPGEDFDWRVAVDVSLFGPLAGA